jgi:hypothetical protein
MMDLSSIIKEELTGLPDSFAVRHKLDRESEKDFSDSGLSSWLCDNSCEGKAWRKTD